MDLVPMVITVMEVVVYKVERMITAMTVTVMVRMMANNNELREDL